MENFSTEVNGFLVRSCDENLLTNNGKPLIHVEICAINPNKSIYTVAYFVNASNQLRVYHSSFFEDKDEDFQKALAFACNKLGFTPLEVDIIST